MLKINHDHVRTALHMAVGAITLLVGAFVFWSIVNADVLMKAMRYPEAVRAMQVEVLISPKAQ